MSINGKLTTFAQELVLSAGEIEKSKINASLEQLERVIKDRLSGQIKEVIRFGSYTRNTLLPRRFDPQSDVDLMVVFDTRDGKLSPGTYRRKLLDVISAAYPNSDAGKSFPAVKLELNHIMFDIVPAYTDSYMWKSYYIPGPGDTWRSTSPNDINDSITTRNQTQGNNTFRNALRLCKHWNAGAKYPNDSYLLEKDLLNVSYWSTDDTYSFFLTCMARIAGSNSGARQAIDYIEQYKRQQNEEKQLEWLKKLLPGMN